MRIFPVFKRHEMGGDFLMVDVNLDLALAKISRIANIEELLQRKIGAEDVFNSYSEDDSIYQRFFSTAGSMHLSVDGDDQFHRYGYSGQARMIQEAIEDTNAQHVLELCSGRGFNLIYLSKQNPQIQFDGVDLMPAHILTSLKRSRSLKNLRCQVGNIEELEYPSGNFDIVFSIESLFHVTNLPKTLSEAYRVLKPGGRMIIIDFFRIKELEAAEPNQRNVIRIAENAFAIVSPKSTNGFVEAAQTVGFTVFDVKELSRSALPDMMRLNRLVGLVFIIPPITRIIARLFSSNLIDGIVGWELMPSLFKSDLMGYFQMEFSRR
jgi:ubiquinone/menaquinone biosynthesis C-methylase UbiE